MKTNIFHSCLALILILSYTKQSNAADGNFRPLENGFGFGSHSQSAYPMHKAIWAGLMYKGTNEIPREVWPYIYTVTSIQITNKTVAFLGQKAKSYDGGRSEGLISFLMAFRAPDGPPLDITDQVLAKWSTESGIAVTNIMPGTLVHLTKTNQSLRLDFAFVKWNQRGPGSIDSADGAVTISWVEIESIIDDVKKTGHLQKEKWSGTEYLLKDVKGANN